MGVVVVGLLRFTVEAVGFMGLLPMAVWPTWVMGGVVTHRAFTAFRLTHTDLLVTR
jgi:hypothetical protein